MFDINDFRRLMHDTPIHNDTETIHQVYDRIKHLLEPKDSKQVDIEVNGEPRTILIPKELETPLASLNIMGVDCPIVKEPCKNQDACKYHNSYLPVVADKNFD